MASVVDKTEMINIYAIILCANSFFSAIKEITVFGGDSY